MARENSQRRTPGKGPFTPRESGSKSKNFLWCFFDLYGLHTEYGEVNVFTGVCHSIHRGGVFGWEGAAWRG